MMSKLKMLMANILRNKLGFTISFVAIILLMQSCSFHSNQLNTVVGIFFKKEDPLAGFLWRATWGTESYDLFAVKAENLLILVDRQDKKIFFDGWQVRQVEGLLLNQQLKIGLKANSMNYLSNDRLLAQDFCEKWQKNIINSDEKTQTLTAKRVVSNASIVHIQKCSGENDYENRIEVDAAGVIVALVFKIHPQFPQIEIVKR